MLADRAQRAMKAGALREADPWEVATVFWSACHGPVSLELKHVGPPTTDWEDVHDHLVEAVIAGLASDPSEPTKRTRSRRTARPSAQTGAL
jgi:hypothetical protein